MVHKVFILLILLLNTIHVFGAPPPENHRFLLVTGCGRSGTDYMTHFLRAQGVDVLHEQIGPMGMVSWIMAPDAKKRAFGHPLFKDWSFDHIFHQVRNPLKVIQSFYNHPPIVTWRWIMSVIPEIQDSDSLLTRCAKYWYYWNLMVEVHAEWTYRIEDIDTCYQEMADRLGLTFDPNILHSVPRNVNTRGTPRQKISWAFLKEKLDSDLYLKVESLAIRYGYTPND